MKRTVKVRSGSGPSDVHVSAWHVPTRLIDDGQSIPNNVLSLLLKYDFCVSLFCGTERPICSLSRSLAAVLFYAPNQLVSYLENEAR